MYEFKCPGSNANYVGKTDRCLYTRIKEYSSLDTSEIYNHIISRNEFNFVINLLELTPNDEVNNIKCSLTDLRELVCKNHKMAVGRIYLSSVVFIVAVRFLLLISQSSIANNSNEVSLHLWRYCKTCYAEKPCFVDGKPLSHLR